MTSVTTKAKPQPGQNRNLMIVGGIIVVAVVAALALIIVSSQGGSTGAIDYSQIPQSRTSDGAFVLGNPAAPVTIVEFADFLCPHCQEYEPTIEAFIKEYVLPGMAKFEYRFFPVIDPTLSRVAAQIIECSDTLDPGSFWRAHDMLYGITLSSRFSTDTPREFATQMGLNYSALLRCTSDAHQVDTDQQLGVQVGVQGTPTLMVRYGDSDPQWIIVGGQVMSGGNVTLQILAITVQAALSRTQ